MIARFLPTKQYSSTKFIIHHKNKLQKLKINLDNGFGDVAEV